MTSLTTRLEFYNLVLANQLGRAIMILVGLVGVWIISAFFPDFFHYNYLGVGTDFFGDLLRFWPLVAWGTGITLISALLGNYQSTLDDEALLTRGALVSTGAGVTEEFWFRGVGVFYAMLILVVWNFILNAVGWLILAFLFLLMALVVISFFAPRFRPTPLNVAGRLLGFATAGVFVWAIATLGQDAVYKVYQLIFFPIIDFMTLGLLKPVFAGDHQLLLVMGMFSANFAFRDGHKYQGLFGWTNSWYLGCVFIYATLFYGIWVAMVVHIVYNLGITGLVYLIRKFRGR